MPKSFSEGRHLIRPSLSVYCDHILPSRTAATCHCSTPMMSRLAFSWFPQIAFCYSFILLEILSIHTELIPRGNLTVAASLVNNWALQEKGSCTWKPFPDVTGCGLDGWSRCSGSLCWTGRSPNTGQEQEPSDNFSHLTKSGERRWVEEMASAPSLANAMAVVGKSGAKPAAETTANYRLSLCTERLCACMHSQVFLGLELMLSMFSPI